ncbi:DNA-3-methyladenine glycosylase I [Marinimicrobium sp. ABcell2]|uniref:DNA-3-methyladenine glycosylase I n=1 Tax=Marinimicrobium sp. ABcell2 TaxID=3069751 RepID=UPI0027AE68BA|nr:DNA-3-methyladenine glycosylase I [Marinimicrobium sp. ABcell2]MDQ2076001.1 DNA-3-methyladenine glycosylase I [Marinimicrobium sp. ABcell2]
MPQETELKRCPWCGDDPLYRAYHDQEWGNPLYDNQQLFEFLILEGAQAGLAWITVLRKREAYRRAFDQFAPHRMARYTPARKAKLLRNPGIIRNRLKVDSAVRNAQAYVAMEKAGEDFSAFLWGFVGGSPLRNRWRTFAEVPVSTSESDAMSRELKKRGFNFVGPTICYAFMQATGMVNDHLVDCYRHSECDAMATPAETGRASKSPQR